MIDINNLTTIRIDEKFLKKVAKKVLAEEKIKKANLSVALVSPQRIRKLNKKYRRKNRPTDVLAFGGAEMLNLKWKIPKTLKEGGEIVISPDMVKKNAVRFNSAFKKELARVLIHGILHLLGYDHERSVVYSKNIRSFPPFAPLGYSKNIRSLLSFRVAKAKVEKKKSSSTSPFAPLGYSKKMNKKQEYYLNLFFK